MKGDYNSAIILTLQTAEARVAGARTFTGRLPACQRIANSTS